ncbi:unnamed protein product [Ranitomeya imitator]|uniref:Uncharacterized protein n=1 Tax=Ranitomeya imitator TaxID=111125 RepID=A0ABN9MF02_9NEOB|nr:unnamed protein product [Ranitomeya imitator]
MGRGRRYHHTKRSCSDTDNDPDRCSVAVWSLESCYTDSSPATNDPEVPGNQGKHRVTKRRAALSNPMFTLVTILKVKKQTLHTYLPLSVPGALLLCSGWRRAAGKHSGDVTALLSGRCAHSQSKEAERRGQTAVEEFVGAGSPRSASYEKNLRILPSAIPTLNVETSCEEPEQHVKETVCITSPSESSESISPITQIDNPAYHGSTTQDEDSACPSAVIEELLEDKPNKQYSPNSEDQAAKVNTQNAVRKDEPASDLRVFELNSDSGKSTPSNNGQKGSSTDVSEDWEKDFDMTEEEVQLALSRVEVSGEISFF